MGFKCSRCGGSLKKTAKELFDLQLCAWECEKCGELVYDFSGKGESCATCPATNTCILK